MKAPTIYQGEKRGFVDVVELRVLDMIEFVDDLDAF